MLKKFNWGHGVIAALGLFIMFILFMIFIFPNGKQNSELISNHYYEDELAYQKTIDAKKLAEKLPEQPKYSQDASGIKITFPKSIQPEDKTVKFILFRTDDGNLDVKKELPLSQDFIHIPAKVLFPGPYTLKIMWNKAGKAYQIDYDVLWKQP